MTNGSENALATIPLHQLKSVHWYFGARCNACDQPIAIWEDPAQGWGERVMKLPRLMRVECPYCKAVSYAQELGRFRSTLRYA